MSKYLGIERADGWHAHEVTTLTDALLADVQPEQVRSVSAMSAEEAAQQMAQSLDVQLYDLRLPELAGDPGYEALKRWLARVGADLKPFL